VEEACFCALNGLIAPYSKYNRASKTEEPRCLNADDGAEGVCENDNADDGGNYGDDGDADVDIRRIMKKGYVAQFPGWVYYDDAELPGEICQGKGKDICNHGACISSELSRENGRLGEQVGKVEGWTYVPRHGLGAGEYIEDTDTTKQED